MLPRPAPRLAARSRHLLRALVALLLAGVGADASAQASSAINAVATLGQGINVTVTRTLTWPAALLPGVASIVAATDATAAAVTLDGAGGDEVSVNFTFPSTLTGPGGATLPLDTWTLCYGTSSTQSACTAYPVASLPLVTRLPQAGGGVIYLWIGAAARPGSTQASGSYTGSLSVLALYTGN